MVVKAKLSFGEKIEEKELNAFARLYIRGFLKPSLIKKSSIEYTGPVGISLMERFSKPITKRDFFFVIEQIVVMSQKISGHVLKEEYLVLDLQNVYINENTKELQFVYLPLLEKKTSTTIMEFIDVVLCAVKLADEEDKDYISRFSFFLKGQEKFDADRIEKYIAKEDRSIVNTIRKQNVGQSGFMTDKQQHYYEHYDSQIKNLEDNEATGLLEEEEATGLLENEEGEVTGLLDEEYEATGLLFEESNETALLIENTSIEPEIHYPTIVRVLTDEQISINKPVFRIGKERSYVDYSVVNNIAVSRSHIDIITRGERYFVIDLNSKNHTYINEEIIPVQCEVEIHDGDNLRLANEEFIFHI